MSRLARIKQTRAIGGDPIIPQLAAAGRFLVGGVLGKAVKAVGGLFGRKAALPVATSVALPVAAGKVGQMLSQSGVSRSLLPKLAAGGAAAWGVSKLVAGDEEKKRRRRKGLSACEIRGYYKVLRLVRKAGMRPKIYKRG